MKEFKKGDRVVVTNLRSGTQHPGVVTKPPKPPSDITTDGMEVKYDTGQTVRVGKGFVRHEVQPDFLFEGQSFAEMRGE